MDTLKKLEGLLVKEEYKLDENLTNGEYRTRVKELEHILRKVQHNLYDLNPSPWKEDIRRISDSLRMIRQVLKGK